MPVVLKNNASNSLAAAITSTDTGIVVRNGNLFPALAAGQYFYATITGADGSQEIVKVTARSGNGMTIVRAQEGTFALPFQLDSRFEMRITAATIADILAEDDLAAAVTIADAGGYYTGGTVEAALQEVGSILTTVPVARGGTAATTADNALVNLAAQKKFAQVRKDVATLLADTTITYTAGTVNSVTTGDVVQTAAEGFSYSVAASGASDHHVTTAGGVKLYELAASYSKATSHTQQLMQRLERGEECNVIFLGDSTGDSTTEWIYKLAVRLGQDYPTHTVRYRTWDTGSAAYGSITTIQTGTSGVNLNVWNASIAGSVATRFAGAELSAAINPVSMGRDPDLLVFNYGHNGGSDIDRQITMTATLVGEASRLLPFTPILLVGQNPVTTDESMAEKVRVFRALAAAQNLGWIDIHQFFKDLPLSLTTYYADTVHPNALGSDIWAAAAHQAFRYDRNGISGNATSSLNRGVILANDSYAYFSGWSASGGLSVSRDAVTFETNGESIRLTGNGTTSAFISSVVINTQDIVAYRGRYVTVTVRLRVPDTAGVDAGRVALFDGTTTKLTANGGPKQSGWVTQAITIKVGESATSLQAYVYLSTSSGTTDEIHVDRITVADGPIPMDSAIPSEVHDLDFLRVIGGRNEGVLVVRNSSSGNRAIQVLDTISGTDYDDPNTQYTLALHSVGLSGKARGDAFDRVQINGQLGYLYFGQGAAAPTIFMSCGGTELLRILGAHFYNETDNTYDLGLVNKRWRRVYGREVRPGAGSVIWTSGAGTPEGSVTAPVGSLYTRTDGGALTTLYVKESGTGATGWVAK